MTVTMAAKTQAQTWHDKTWALMALMALMTVRISQWTLGNLETKYCGEVIGDGV